MADPLSVGASVVGLISVATHVSSKLLEFVGDSNDAPALARHVMSEIYAIKAAITSLQTYLWGESRATGSQESMVLVEHLAVALTACVFTFNELEKEVSALKSGYNMKTLERVKWARKKGAIAQLFARLQNHKSSLSLILDILQSQTNAHAERSLENLYVAISETLNFQREIAERLKRLETGVGPARSTLTVREDSLAVDTSSLYSFQSASSRRTARAIVSKFRFAFDATLETSRVYRRSKLRYLGSPEGSGSSSIAARSMGWSFMSGLSIADISQVSVLSLPIYSLDLPNSKFYTFNYKTRHSEAASGEEDAVQVLPKISSSIDVVDQKDLWVEKLHITAARGLTDEVQLLINDGVDISTIWENETALGRASRGGHKDTVELLLSKGADISAVDKGEWTALHHAARYGHKDTVELLLSKGADISAVDKDKWTALHHAATCVYKDTVGLLLSKGADISAVDKEGRTVLHHAAGYERKGMVEFLLSKGADILAVDKGEWTALHYAARYGYKGMVELLLSRGADVSAVDKDKWTALHHAARCRDKDMVELLLSKGADISAVDRDKWTALHHAARYGHKDTVELLLSKGADILAVDRDKWTALHHAARYGYKDTVEFLLSKGADISAVDKDQWTALHHAARYGYKDTAELLLSKGGVPSAVMRGVRTTLILATEIRRADIAKIIESYPKGKGLSIQDSAKVPSTGNSETPIALEGQPPTTELSTVVE